MEFREGGGISEGGGAQQHVETTNNPLDLRKLRAMLAATSPDSSSDDLCSSLSPRVTRAAVALQCVTTGHIGRLQFHARCLQVAQQLESEAL